MHGGTVIADSPGIGQGSLFTVSLPAAARSEHAPHPHRQPGRVPHPRSGRVLVVDDNVDAARSMARVLTMLGNEVQTAHDGVEAVQAAERWHPEVILMDVAMPRMNGYDATRHIRERPWGDEPVIVALTGWGLESDRERSRDAGCDGHLVKPVGLVDLEATLDQLLAARQGPASGSSPSAPQHKH
jgi:CheY-like chemotaxis protein